MRWKSSDGLMVDGYVVFPLNYDRQKLYPAVVIIHGGPAVPLDASASDWPGQNYFIDLLLKRGYIVFFPDYRLSQNFGFAQVLKCRNQKELLRLDFKDVMTGVDYLQHERIIDGKRVALLGHSWGSTEVNWIITQTRRFAAAVSYEGSDFSYFSWGTKAGPNPALEWYLRSSPLDDPDKWVRQLPMYHARGVTTPTMFVSNANGVNSPALPWMYAAWSAQRVDTKLLIYSGEGHVLESKAAQIDLVKRILEWLTTHGVSGSPLQTGPSK